MKIELDINIPEGYEATGEVRPPRAGDFFMIGLDGNHAHLSDKDFTHVVNIILRPKKRKVVKFVEDVNGEYVMVGAWGPFRYHQDSDQGATRYTRIETTE